jgi:hypothetical protein
MENNFAGGKHSETWKSLAISIVIRFVEKPEPKMYVIA